MAVLASTPVNLDRLMHVSFNPLKDALDIIFRRLDSHEATLEYLRKEFGTSE